jgi:hypothetical protein
MYMGKKEFQLFFIEMGLPRPLYQNDAYGFFIKIIQSSKIVQNPSWVAKSVQMDQPRKYHGRVRMYTSRKQFFYATFSRTG